jgi:uncharacterized delta-60 repeat protein
VFDLSGGDDRATSLALQPDGRIILAGSSRDNVSVVRLSRGGHMDRYFGNKGKLFTQFGGIDQATRVAVRPDQTIMIAGTTVNPGGSPRSDIILGRYLPDGRLDGRFGGDGRVTYSFVRYDTSPALVVQSDGKVVVAGDNVARFDNAGRLDLGFGDGGKTSTGFVARDLATAGGRLVAVGAVDRGGAFSDLAVSRITRDGRPDRSFGRDGIASAGLLTPNFARAFASSVAVGRDGTIVVAGGLDTLAGRHLAMARYRADGSLDRRFGDAGRLVDLTLPEVHDVAVQPDSKVIAIGPAWLLRRNSNGTPDANFGESGRVNDVYGDRVAVLPDRTIATSSAVFASDGTRFADLESPPIAGNFADLTAQSDGRIVSVYDSFLCGGGDEPFCLVSYFNVVRHLPDGRLDASFDEDGVAVTDLGATEPDGTDAFGGFPKAVTVQADGKIVVAGRFTDGPATGDPEDGPIIDQLVVVRYHRDGSLDSGFGRDGIVLRDFPPPPEPDQLPGVDIIGVSVGADGEVAVALPDGIVAIAANGRSSRFVRFSAFPIAAITRQEDGKLVAVGAGPDDTFGVARFREVAGSAA